MEYTDKDEEIWTAVSAMFDGCSDEGKSAILMHIFYRVSSERGMSISLAVLWLLTMVSKFLTLAAETGHAEESETKPRVDSVEALIDAVKKHRMKPSSTTEEGMM